MCNEIAKARLDDVAGMKRIKLILEKRLGIIELWEQPKEHIDKWNDLQDDT